MDYASAIENELEEIKDYQAKTAEIQGKLKEFVLMIESAQKKYMVVDQ